MTRTAWVSHFASLQESGLLKAFTGPLANTLPITVRKSRSRRKMSSAPAAPLVDASHTTDGWKSSVRNIPPMSALVAEGADFAP